MDEPTREEIVAWLQRYIATAEPYARSDTIVAADVAAATAALRELEAGGWRDGQRLWLWKNGDHFLAYAHEYPCYPDGGDPLTLGEPIGCAILTSGAPPTTSDGGEG